MNTQQNMEERLWDFIDGRLAAEEKPFIEQLIATNNEWKSKYHELLEVHELMSNHLELDQPSMRFTQNVMEEIGKLHITPAAKTYINKRVIWGIFSFFMLTIVCFLVYGFSQVSWKGSGGSSNLPFDASKVDFSKIDFSAFFNSTYTTILMMVNIVLGLFLLDMYLAKKKKEHLAKHA